MPPKPVDFINSLSNTGGFYIAKSLGLESKNLNMTHHGFVVGNALMLAQAELLLGKEKQILIGGVDEKPGEHLHASHYLGIDSEQSIGEGSNWLLLSTVQEGAIAGIDVCPHTYTKEALLSALVKDASINGIAFGQRVERNFKQRVDEQCKMAVFDWQIESDFYETNLLFAISLLLKDDVNNTSKKIALIDAFENSYRVIYIYT